MIGWMDGCMDDGWMVSCMTGRICSWMDGYFDTGLPSGTEGRTLLKVIYIDILHCL